MLSTHQMLFSSSLLLMLMLSGTLVRPAAGDSHCSRVYVSDELIPGFTTTTATCNSTCINLYGSFLSLPIVTEVGGCCGPTDCPDRCTCYAPSLFPNECNTCPGLTTAAEQSTTDGTTAMETTTMEATTMEPTTMEPTTMETTTMEPTTMEPTTMETTTMETTTMEPTTMETTTMETTTMEPTTMEPTTMEPTTMEATTMEATTEGTTVAPYLCSESAQKIKESGSLDQAYNLYVQPCTELCTEFNTGGGFFWATGGQSYKGCCGNNICYCALTTQGYSNKCNTRF